MNKFFLVFTFFLYSFIIASAQERDSCYLLKEVVVSYQANKNSPISYLDISSKELISKSTGQEPSFILSETPSITAYSDAGNLQGYSYFRLRGIDQTRINMTLDGVPLNEPEDQGAYFSNYPDLFNTVSKVQVQRGVGTTQNGVASFGGSIQLFSPNLADSTNNSVGFNYGSFDTYRAFAKYNSGLIGHKSIYLRVSDLHSDGYKYHSGNNSQSIFLSTGLFYSKNIWKLNIMAGHQKNELAWLGVPDSLIKSDRRINLNENENDNFAQSLVQLQNKWLINSISTLQTSIYYNYLKGNYDFNLNSYLGLPTTNEMYNYALLSNLMGFYSNYTINIQPIRWTTGIHTNIYNREHIGSLNTIGQLYENKGFKNELSVFSQIEYHRNKWSCFADFQYRYTSFDYDGSVAFEKMQWSFFNPKLGISYLATNNTTLYYSIGSSKREPTRSDIFGGNDNLLADSNGNPIIFIKTPEYNLDQELGIRAKNGNFNLNTNLYYMDFKNEIVLDGKFGPNGLALTNDVEKSIRAGLEVEFVWKLSKKITYNNNSSFNYSRIKEGKESFSPILTPPIIVNQEVTYQSFGFIFGISSRYQSESYIDFTNSTSLKEYFILNTRVEYTLRKLVLSLFVNNISNADYYNNGYVEVDGTAKYFVQTPLNFTTSIKYSF